MYTEIISSKKSEFENAIEHLYVECNKLRTGRANASLVENLKVDYYGTPTELKQAANITIPEARQILIQPWDKSLLDMIEQAINKADLGVSPANDGVVIRISLPPMTEQNRKDLVKILNQKIEEARIRIRGVRESIWKEILAQEKKENASEDEKFIAKENLQKVVGVYNSKIDEIKKKTEEDIMTI